MILIEKFSLNLATILWNLFEDKPSNEIYAVVCVNKCMNNSSLKYKEKMSEKVWRAKCFKLSNVFDSSQDFLHAIVDFLQQRAK